MIKISKIYSAMSRSYELDMRCSGDTKRDQVVLFIGPGVSKNSGIPKWEN